RTGDWISQHRQFVREDSFSFSKAGQPWFAWEWSSDILFSSSHSAMGMKGSVLLTIALSSSYSASSFRQMVWRGANIFIAFPSAMLGFGAASVHSSARPHVWTMVSSALSGWMIQRDSKSPDRRIWSSVPLTVVWTNLHGGWSASVAVSGSVAA
ncbi:hypothetical protein OY671_012232, partial [Metschnikowia pulcherrima]